MLAAGILVLGPVILAEIPLTRTAVRTSIPGRVIRWCLGEPGFTQWANDTAETISSQKETPELQELADQFITDYGPISSTLPDTPFGGGKTLPVDKLPLKYRQLGGMYADPDVILRLDGNGLPFAVFISWGHGRESIQIFSKPPMNPPQGFFVRQASHQIYVVVGES